MRFVETITGELLHQVEDFHRQFGINTVVFGPFGKNRPLLGHLFWFFLTHGPAQQVSTAEGVTSQLLRDLHHLLLIEDDAVSGFKDRFQAVMLVLRIRVGDLLTAVLTIDEVIHHARLQRPGAKQCYQRDHVFETIGL